MLLDLYISKFIHIYTCRGKKARCMHADVFLDQKVSDGRMN